MGEWKNGLCSCFNNLSVCLLSWIVPCYVEGKTAEKVGDNCFIYGLLYLFVPCITGAMIRGKVREKNGIDGGFIGDCLMHTFCNLCALAQEAQEIDSLGMSRE